MVGLSFLGSVGAVLTAVSALWIVGIIWGNFDSESKMLLVLLFFVNIGIALLFEVLTAERDRRSRERIAKLQKKAED